MFPTSAVIVFAAVLAAPIAHAEVKVIDGDSFKMTVRLAGADTPELRGKCVAEKKLAQEAKRFAEGFLSGNDWTMVHAGFGLYKRPLVDIVKRDGRRLSEELIKRQLARRWEGGRKGWCD